MIDFVVSARNHNYLNRRSGFDCNDCEVRVFLELTVNRFTKVILCVFYNAVWGRPAQSLDSQECNR